MNFFQPVREWLGVAVYDWPRYRRAFAASAMMTKSVRGWASLCNRIERLTPSSSGPGMQCEWEWGSDLHACHVWPSLGRRLMQVALNEWPMQFADAPTRSHGSRVSFIIAHGGRSRLPQLRRTIRSLFAQTDVDLECIVVDQSDESSETELPAGIVYRHLMKTNVERGWHKSWAYNVGARMATGDLLVFHDGDICVPQRYASELVRTLTEDAWDVASIQRFLFYLTKADTALVESSDQFPATIVPQRVYQNWKGGTIAIRRDAFFAIGGFDEGFVDWGGEDDEFYNRCRQALRHCRFGYLPFVHLWHPPQTGRKALDNPNIAQVLPWRMAMPLADRVRELSRRDFGNPDGPDPVRSYKTMSMESSASAASVPEQHPVSAIR